MSLNIVDIIRKKRNGEVLSTNEIQYMVQSMANGKIEDSQIGALLMAIFLNGLTKPETADLTREMVHSGDLFKFNEDWSKIIVDKHSTGGVGDKVSLVLAPALAACGLKVPMVSGRGLEFTGGTLDKLESIPGFNVQLNYDQMAQCLDKVGCFIAGATDRLAPADKLLYKHRDVTCTVDKVQLVVSSIVSKKVAEGCKYLVQDVKVGKAAFFKNVEDARELSKYLIEVAEMLGVKTHCVLTEMDNPLGKAVGNRLEVLEAVTCLKNGGPADLDEIVDTLGGILLEMTGQVKSLEEGKKKIRDNIKNGEALIRFESMLVHQGVEEEVAKELCRGDPNKVIRKSQKVTGLRSSKSGIIKHVDAMIIARSCWLLGAGRTVPDQLIDHSVGVVLYKTVGDAVECDETLLEVHHNESLDKQILQQLTEAFDIQTTNSARGQSKSRIIEII